MKKYFIYSIFIIIFILIININQRYLSNRNALPEKKQPTATDSEFRADTKLVNSDAEETHLRHPSLSVLNTLYPDLGDILPKANEISDPFQLGNFYEIEDVLRYRVGKDKSRFEYIVRLDYEKIDKIVPSVPDMEAARIKINELLLVLGLPQLTRDPKLFDRFDLREADDIEGKVWGVREKYSSGTSGFEIQISMVSGRLELLQLHGMY